MLDLDVELRYVDSIKNPYIQLADFVAGAVRAKHIGTEFAAIPVHPTTNDQRSTGNMEGAATRVDGGQLASINKERQQPEVPVSRLYFKGP